MSPAPLPSALGAEFSADRTHRYLLWRVWDAAAPLLGYVMLNPSSADETRDDPTTIRNMRRAKALGYGGVVQANLYSYRTASPTVLRRLGRPGAGGLNYLYIGQLAERCPNVVLAWGAHALPADGAALVAKLRALPQPPRLLHLGRLKNGAPRHPLHTAYATALQPWGAP